MSAPYTSRPPGGDADQRGAASARPKRRAGTMPRRCGNFEGAGQRKPARGGIGIRSAKHYNPVTGRRFTA